MHRNTWKWKHNSPKPVGHCKIVLRGRFIAIQAYLKKREKSQINNPPCLLNLYAEYIMRNARLEEAQAGIKIAGRNINNLRCIYMPVLCCVLCLIAQSCLTVFDPWTAARQAPLSMGILQARILEWAAMPSSRGSSQARDQTHVSCMAGGFFTTSAT